MPDGVTSTRLTKPRPKLSNLFRSDHGGQITVVRSRWSDHGGDHRATLLIAAEFEIHNFEFFSHFGQTGYAKILALQ